MTRPRKQTAPAKCEFPGCRERPSWYGSPFCEKHEYKGIARWRIEREAGAEQ